MLVYISLIRESTSFALNALRSNKLRTSLSLLGITIGIFSIISVFTVVDSLESNLRNSIRSLGENVIFIAKWPWEFKNNYPWWKYINRPVPQYDELEKITAVSKKSEAAAFTVSFNRTIKQQNNSAENATINAISHDYSKVQNLDIEKGRYFSDNESASGSPVVIIGATLSDALFPLGNAIGNHIKIQGRKVQVIGVIKKQGESLLGNNYDDNAFIPVLFSSNFIDINSENSDPIIMVKAKSGVPNEELIGELSGIMRSIRKLKPLADDNFALNQTSLISNEFDIMFDAVGMAGWIIGGFSILVGGFGIANIMFVSVKERTGLIGIQKSLGAKNLFILIQFLFEAVLLCIIGGVIGLILIYAGTLLVGDSFGLEILLSRSNIVLGFTISILIGIISGFIPAYSASQLDPVEAIRSNN